jgi:hypothetical protein
MGLPGKAEESVKNVSGIFIMKKRPPTSVIKRIIGNINLQ